ncbi:MAG: GNAT family N-acetyltransferase [Oceanicoccus sp.]
MIHFSEVSGDSIPADLLLIADPSEEKINSYLKGAVCFAAVTNNNFVGACVTNINVDGEVEIFNIATVSSVQGQGVGSKLLEFVISELGKRTVNRLVLGTGTFGYQLVFYQRLGFRVDAVVKDFFIDNYDEPIYENGIQHFDMLRLTLDM